MFALKTTDEPNTDCAVGDLVRFFPCVSVFGGSGWSPLCTSAAPRSSSVPLGTEEDARSRLMVWFGDEPSWGFGLELQQLTNSRPPCGELSGKLCLYNLIRRLAYCCMFCAQLPLFGVTGQCGGVWDGRPFETPTLLTSDGVLERSPRLPLLTAAPGSPFGEPDWAVNYGKCSGGGRVVLWLACAFDF